MLFSSGEVGGGLCKPWLLGTPWYHPHCRPRSLCTPFLGRLCTSELHLKTSPLIASFVGEKLLSSKAEQDVLMKPGAASGGLYCSTDRRGTCRPTLGSKGNIVLFPQKPQVLMAGDACFNSAEPQCDRTDRNTCEET